VALRWLAESPETPTEQGIEHGLVFVGMTVMIDPARPEVRDAVAITRAAGVRPVMITGDHPLTALHIARELGIATNDKVLTGQELRLLRNSPFMRGSRPNTNSRSSRRCRRKATNGQCPGCAF
jgi:Ca2+-transporting ATPase